MMYNTLATYLGGASVAGSKMKLTGTKYWNSPNTGATNESLFYLYLIKGYTISGTQPFNGLPIELYRSQPLIVDGIGKIKYKFGYTYI